MKTATSDVANKRYLNGKEIGEHDLAGTIERLLRDVPAGRRTVLLKIQKDMRAACFHLVIEAVSQAGGEIVHGLKEEKKSP